MPQNKFYYVYMFTFPSGKQYCGYTSNIDRRWSRQGAEYKKCPLVYRAIQKYGWENVQKEIVLITEDQQEALNVEKAMIEDLDLLNIDKGYNLIEGGISPPHGKKYLTEEGYKKLQANGKRLANEVWGNPEKAAYAIQRMREETHKKRMMMTEQERKDSYGKHNIGRRAPNAKAIYQLDKNTLEIIQEFPSSRDAAKALGDVSYAGNIRTCAGGRKNSAYGYKWRWKDENPSS